MRRLVFVGAWVLAAAAGVGCGGPPGETSCGTVDQDRLARRVGDDPFARIHGSSGAGHGSADSIADAVGDVTRIRVPIGDAPVRGAVHPLVTIVQFSDFQCPFCGMVEPTLGRLLRDHPDEIRLVFRNEPLPFHPHAMPAAEAAMEAQAQRGNAGFWRMHDLLFANQRALTRPDLERYAQKIGLDVAAFQHALDTGAHADAIRADAALGARLGVRGTPGQLIDGRLVMGARPYADFDRVVLDEIARAHRLLAVGVPRDRLYDTFMGQAQDAPTPSPSAAIPEPPSPPADAVYDVPVDRSPVRGSADALVTIVEFGDFQCPFCGRVQQTVEVLRARYGHDLRIVWKNDPLDFHPNAVPAAVAALEARAQGGDTAFWQMHDLLYRNQQDLSRATLERLATQLHLDMARFRRALDQQTHADAIRADQALSDRLGVDGTPAFFINGQLLMGAQPLDAFTQLVDARLADARARVQGGTPRANLYDAVVAGGVASRADAIRRAAATGGAVGGSTP